MKTRIPAVLAGILACALIGGIALATYPGRSTSAEVVVWQRASDPAVLYLSTRAGDGAWQTGAAPLALTPSRSARFLRSDVVTIDVPLPEPPVAPEAPSPGPATAPVDGSSVGLAAIAQLAGPDGAAMGHVEIVQGPQGLVIRARVHGLAPGGHGFHIHETGACAPDFAAAGDHFNPTHASHGALFGPSRHAGDLPNLYAAADGKAAADVFTAAATLARGQPHSLFGAGGTAIIVHEKPDTYGEAAGAGGRVACGVIRPADDSVSLAAAGGS